MLTKFSILYTKFVYYGGRFERIKLDKFEMLCGIFSKYSAFKNDTSKWLSIIFYILQYVQLYVCTIDSKLISNNC